MGKASRKKIQKESRAKPLLKDKPLEAEETSVKWSLFNKPIVHFFLIAIVGFFVYSNTFNVPFHFDDTPNIVANYKLKDLNNLWPPSGSRWFGFFTFALNYHFGGLNTIGYHAVNLTIHILNAILVYWLVVFTFRTQYFSYQSPGATRRGEQSAISSQENINPYSPLQISTYLPLFIALLFVAHPIQTQAVTYIVQRFTSLATMFYLLSLVMYIKFRLTPSLTLPPRGGGMGGWATTTRYTLYAVSFFSAILAMKTKEISFTLPVVIALYEFMFFEGKIKRRILFLMSIILTMLIIPLSLIGTDKPIGDVIGEIRELSQETEEIPRWSYLFTQFRVIVTYIRLLFLPINQNLDYDYPIYHSFFESEVFLSFLFLLLIFGIGVCLFYRSRISHPEPKAKGLRDSSATPQTCPERDDEILPLNQVQGQNDRKRRNDINIPTRYTLYATRLIAFGILWFFITLSVESSIIPIRDVTFEHRVYLPSVGIIIAFTSSFFYGLQFTIHRSWFIAYASRFFLTATYSLLTIAVIALSIATYQRNIVWKDEMNLWEDVVKKSPNKARGHNEVGVAYKDKGWFDKAIEHYQTALRLKPDLPEVHNNLGIAYSNKEWFDTAIEHYQTALRLKPDYPEVYINLGNVYKKIGLREEAMQKYQAALLLKPSSSIAAVAHYNLGIIYLQIGLINEAKNKFQLALKLKPDFVEARQNLEFLMK